MERIIDLDFFVEELLQKNDFIIEFEIVSKAVIAWLLCSKKKAEKISKAAVKNLEESDFVSFDKEHLVYCMDTEMSFTSWLFRVFICAKGYANVIFDRYVEG